ncbi:MAG TPA: plasmid replication/partition related protein, partial [Dehalococcoidia bacterium]|nr:plasmid replication/partition related protein [Dehalococcoidia bacterium]
MLDAEGTLIDGRNRLRACQIAGVAPTFTTLAGHDPVAYILGANVSRRHLSKGQAAMAVALTCLETKRPQRAAADAAGVNAGRVGQAAVVCSYAPELAEQVMAG